jgi:tetrapyrrole methylase family protein/MazG family protein/ATP diphosphatase
MSKEFDELVGVMARLRSPEGCPWDREQTYVSLAPYVIEEAYETFDAIQSAAEGNPEHLKEELGDLLLQIVFHSQIAAERGDFTVGDVAAEQARKLTLRHPHVFGEQKFGSAGEVLENWDKLKAGERAASGKSEKSKDSILAEVPVHFPALLEAQKVTKKAAKVGFDWPSADQVFDKIAEEIGELRTAIAAQTSENIEEEVGDLLFAVVNLARKLNVDSETALNKTNRKFRKRFSFIEKQLLAQDKTWEEAGLEEMDRLWEQAKATEHNAG